MRCRMLVLAAGLAALATPALADFYIVQELGNETLLHRRTAADHPDERHRRRWEGIHVAHGSGGCLEDRQGLRERRNGWRTRGGTHRACAAIGQSRNSFQSE